MSRLLKCLNVFTVVCLLSGPALTTEIVPWHSPWGTVADFTREGCSHWELKPEFSLPALDQTTVCLSLKLQDWGDSPWTAFMYRHPEKQHAELGLGGRDGHLMVLVFGEQWKTEQNDINLLDWSSLCVTWSQKTGRPVLYVNGKPKNLKTDASSTPSLRSPIAPNGTLTLGAGHSINSGNIQVLPNSKMLGKVSLFRMWWTERTEEEISSKNCIEGNLITWESQTWDTRPCAPIPDPSLQCEWSLFQVRLVFAILRHDETNTDLSTAKEMALNLFTHVLPSHFSVHTLTVYEVNRFDAHDQVKRLHEDRLTGRATPIIDRFSSWVFLRVDPAVNVAAVQALVYTKLCKPYNVGNLSLISQEESIRTKPVESVPATTADPSTHPMTSTPSTFAPASNPTPTPETLTQRVTTTSSAIVTSSVHIADLYFEVRINVTLKGSVDTEESISTWLDNRLPRDQMTVLDLELLPKTKRQHSHLYSKKTTSHKVLTDRVSREGCVFQLQVITPSLNAQEMEEQIRQLLMAPYKNGSVSIVTEGIEISRILMAKCSAESHQTRRGLFVWPETLGGSSVTHDCPKNASSKASRQCKLGISTRWMDPDMEDCPRIVETILDLDHIKVTLDNAMDMLEMIKDLLSNQSMLDYQELNMLLSKLEDIIECREVSQILGQALINVISDIVKTDSNLVPFINTILNLTEAVGDEMVVYNGSSTLLAPAIAVSAVDVVPEEFESLTFGVSSDQTGTNPKVYINSSPFNETVAFVSLPSALQHSFPHWDPHSKPPRVQFQFYGLPVLFGKNPNGWILNTFVVSASVTNASAPVKDLSEKVKVTLRHLKPNTLQRKVSCVYWDFNKNYGHGGWDGRGCQKFNSSSDSTTCLCDHLTHFGVLLDVSRTSLDPFNEQILTIITYVGCGVSSLFLGITVLTYTAFDKLRRDYPSQILINLSLALLGLNLVFLVNSWLSSWGLHALCVAVASLLHYFLLASFTWMGLEAVNMYFALVKVFNVYVPSYILKFCVLGWGIPLVICVLVLSVNRDAYGSQVNTDSFSFTQLDQSDQFCWLQDNVTFYVSVVAYTLIICLFNIGVFVVVLMQIRQMHANSPAGSHSGLMQDLKGVTSITLLLGLTWTVGFFTFGPARIFLLYLFAVLNTLQEWSHSVSAAVVAKPKTSPSVHSIKSSSTASTSASSDSSQRESTCTRPNLVLFVNSLNLPRAQRRPSVTLTRPSNEEVTPISGLRNQFLDPENWRYNHQMTKFAYNQRNNH
ncbi:adhesion G-protein coupled receptor G4-like isoform X2 [Gouania willdenowi]|uniref:adhesion G-protein coupled receptor G4-like isoform X2 n=1 Tax=Gouania willdenowi TaxID=441366 RepID=UPI001054F413|nr:adhesion G-protein coupled receptor G4-like isoform X2 [Gouania willdenowi]